MKVKILYFASLREQLGKGAEEFELPEGIATLGSLRAQLVARGAAWEAALGAGRLVCMAVNQDMVQGDAAIEAGDEIAFFPPVTGG